MNKATKYQQRQRDWRNGALVYQVLPDRFAPATDLDSKKHLYPAPKKLKSWQQAPQHGHYLDNVKLWSHEIEFWGGDFASLSNHLHYIKSLSVDVVYLNPIHLGYTNHKYDSLDFHKISPEFGSRADLLKLADKIHTLEMKLVLDGVFNHMGRNAPIFQQALADKNSQYRNWFIFDNALPEGYRCWNNAANLPELNLENPAVQAHIWAGENSVVQSYLKQGIDGWRLDVAHDIGYQLLTELTQAVHSVNSNALIVGEIWCYPQNWLKGAVDGVMNFTAREIIWRTCQQHIKPHIAMRMLKRMVEDAGVDNLLKSWLVLDNHDTPRLASMLPEYADQQLARALMMSLPGSPNLYYGSELGMQGGDDPLMRGPMQWQLNTPDNPHLKDLKALIKMRKNSPALTIGDIRFIDSDNLLAFERYTDRVAESVFCLFNVNSTPVTEYLMTTNSSLMNMGGLNNALTEQQSDIYIKAGLIKVTLPAKSFLFLSPKTQAVQGYTTYKRVP
ncbi:alpha-amylase family glycosyl hydrolase [Catenovulum adriaticum]|uniref:Alpha-amylase family glycosyl hydrolase n=1 Tax=Catenovulum adriaticum TaxID=2984846 RepID=A0ABY7AL84_9ALTE|nr:alpha-amylase family glycosyl hydrolase [Catenovulum sp. TS8]WAJ70312.1 alpha-amylase family glycosyl hydrolase [Catenovulum sp. TS8]